MSPYVAKPDLHEVNLKRSESLSDIAVLFISTVVFVIVGLLVLSYIVQTVAVRVAPNVEQRWLNNYVDLTPGESIHNDKMLEILRKITPEGLPYQVHFKVQCTRVINAYALPGGTIVFTQGLLEKINTEQGLAFVAGHEIGHLQNRDHLRGVGLWFTFLVAKFFTGVGDLPFFAHFQYLIQAAYSREREAQADTFSVMRMLDVYTSMAGADELFQILLRAEKGANGQSYWFMRTHPVTQERWQRVQTLLPRGGPYPSFNIRALRQKVLCEAKCLPLCG